jgi:hypothetical protein
MYNAPQAWRVDILNLPASAENALKISADKIFISS